MNKKVQSKIFLTIIAIIAIVIFGIFLKNKKTTKAVSYDKATVAKRDVLKTIDVDGKIKADIYADISSEIPALVKKVYVKENDFVEKGDRLFDLDKKSISAQINAGKIEVEKAELAEKLARRHWDNLKPENRKSIVKTTAEAREKLNEIYAQAGKTTVRSPIDGTVVVENIQPGEVATGLAMKIIDLNSLKLEALVPEVDISKVNNGDSVEVVFDAYPDKKIAGEIIEIDSSATLNQGNTYYKIKIKLSGIENLKILNGMNSTVYIITDSKKQALAVPRDFAKKDDQGYFVQVVSQSKGGDKLVKKYFSPGLIGDNNIEVKDGLTGDLEIVKER